jgi:hypothetical protein
MFAGDPVSQGCRGRARPLAAIGCVFGLTATLPSCATPESPSEPRPDASTPDTLSEERLPDTSIDAKAESAVDAAEGGADDLEEPVETCSESGTPEASGSPCTPGQMERAWCGLCGRRSRSCGHDAIWMSWSDCTEDDQAQCSPCQSLQIGCGRCGIGTLRCDISQERCRWVMEGCVASGQCSPGDFEVNQAGCSINLTHVRWCQSGCVWGPFGGCEQRPGWLPMANSPLSPRTGAASAVLAGHWLLWGGDASLTQAQADGALYDPVADRWEPMPEVPDLADAGSDGGARFQGRSRMAVVSTETDVVLWGGKGPGTVFGDGMRFEVSSRMWRPMGQQDAPSPRFDASAVWDDSDGEAIVWGGTSPYGGPAPGGKRYRVATDQWLPVALSALGSRRNHTAVWDNVHRRMIVWGGMRETSVGPERSGASYDPSRDTWSPIADAPIRRAGHVAFWDAPHHKMLVLFGNDGLWDGPRTDGAAYDPDKDQWTMISDQASTGVPLGAGYSAAWGDGKVWVTGGDGAGQGSATALGARYDPEQDAWAKLPAMNQGRSGHASAVLGTLLVWAGESSFTHTLDTGQRLRPMR